MKTLTGKLEELTKEQLVTVLESLASQNKTYEKEIKTLLFAYDPKEFYKLVSKEVTSITSNRKFYGYWECHYFADKVRGVVNKIDKFLVPQAPDLAIKLAKKIIDKEEKIAENIDDSNGEMGEAFSNLFMMLDRAYANSTCKPLEIATFIYETLDSAKYGYKDYVLNFSKCLNEDVLSALESILVPVNKLNSGGDKRYEPDVSATLHKIIADKRKDIDGYIAVCKAKGDLNYEYTYLNIAQRYIDAFQEDKAIEYLQNVTHENFQRDKKKLLIDAYLLDGNITKVKETLWESTFDGYYINNSSYLQYLSYASNDEKTKIKDEIKKVVLAKDFNHSTISELYNIEEFDLLEKELITFSKSGKVLDLYYSVSEMRKISTYLAKSNPIAAVIIRRILLENCLDGGKSKYYDYAVSDLKKSIEFAESIEQWKEVKKPIDYFNSLIEKHKKKVSFWSRVADAGIKEKLENLHIKS
ncbi:hypothetical protein IB642_00205 [Allofrancisella guangzhouensis]|uniref:Uncharacterized protein n=1 Tax=Allofrancisella guangzhouensis TaxID=594679 RepID=A0A0A8E999_9GAMM|nr:DUF6880 family protein [Allofrancisella guangzhouensis]AJC48741.1 hypothetical protein SD28_03340 [Allofrancisella guangzhouensis]MBK2027376.1 hypothetical protein [Allofrancisella guangzhouensis]MBK2043439.1 hypothetical protein [Allofrancisella guangzhouensis]MBK2045208.1 hypothetical protein [Allofrancisella guangzhouensis]